MPYINRKGVREKHIQYKSEKKEIANDFYTSVAWRRLRDTYISLRPLCECCLAHERVVPASEVHHVKPFLRGETEEERWSLFLDEKNLMSVCRKCHNALHNKDREYNLNSLDELTEKEYNAAHQIDDFE